MLLLNSINYTSKKHIVNEFLIKKQRFSVDSATYFRLGKPFCLSASYTTIATEFERFRER